jgi:hypothetical protein
MRTVPFVAGTNFTTWLAPISPLGIASHDGQVVFLIDAPD